MGGQTGGDRPADLLLRRSVDAQDWAKSFMSVFSGRSGDIDEGTMIAWFANYRFVVEESVTHEAENEFNRFMESIQDWNAGEKND